MSGDDRPTDDTSPEKRIAEDPPDLQANIKSRSTWLRLVFIIVLGTVYAFTRLIVFAVVVLQFLWVLFTSERNVRLMKLGHSLALYTAELIDYLCYVTDERPFPFDKDWPDDETWAESP